MGYRISSISFILKNVAFFHAKLWLDVCPRIDNQTTGDTLQDLTWHLVEKSQSASYPSMGIEASFFIYKTEIVVGMKKSRHVKIVFVQILTANWGIKKYLTK